MTAKLLFTTALNCPILSCSVQHGDEQQSTNYTTMQHSELFCAVLRRFGEVGEWWIDDSNTPATLQTLHCASYYIFCSRGVVQHSVTTLP